MGLRMSNGIFAKMLVKSFSASVTEILVLKIGSPLEPHKLEHPHYLVGTHLSKI